MPVNVGILPTLAEAQGRRVAAALALLETRHEERMFEEPIWTSHGVVCFCETENVVTLCDRWGLPISLTARVAEGDTSSMGRS